MKVTIVTAVFPPEPVMSALMTSDLAEALTDRGHQVTVITSFPNRPSGYLMAGFKRKWVDVETKNGYRIFRCWHTLSRKSTLISRAIQNLTFGLTTTWRIWLEEVPDVVYILTWPVISVSLNTKLLAMRGVPIVTSVQDMYPESLTTKGKLQKNGVAEHLILWIMKFYRKRFSIITTLNESMRNMLIHKRKISPEKIRLIPIWLDEKPFIDEQIKSEKFRTALGIDKSTFVAIFAGSLTMSAGLDIYIQAAELLKSNSDIMILLVGDGSERKNLEEQIAKKRLKGIRVIHPLSPNEVPEVQASADVLLMSLSGEMAQNAAPSKQVSYMFSGRPIVANISADGTPARILSENRAGFVLPPDDPNSLAELMMQLEQDRTQLEEMGTNGRSYALEHFSKSKIMPQLIEAIEDAAK